MVDKITSNEGYFAPVAEEANKGWLHLVEYCLDHYETAKNSKYRAKKEKEIEESVAVYNQEEKNSSELWEGEANYTVPLTTISCDNLEPRIVSGLIGKKPFVAFEMDNDQKKDEPTEILEAWFNQELEDVGSAFSQLDQSYYANCVSGHKGQKHGSGFEDHADFCGCEWDVE